MTLQVHGGNSESTQEKETSKKLFPYQESEFCDKCATERQIGAEPKKAMRTLVIYVKNVSHITGHEHSSSWGT